MPSKKESKKVTEAPPASVHGSGLPGATKNTPSLMDVLRANGEEHLYDKIMELSVHVEENPPIIFGWQHVEEFVQAIEKAHALAGEPDSEPLPPSPFRLHAPVTVKSFKEAVLDFVKIPEAEARLETTCLPCTLAQSVDVGGRLQELDFDPWIRRVFDVEVVKAPIAFVYLPRAQSNTLERVLDRPGSLWGH
ncbi:hypothetical protein DVH05_017511 [Phytophthora capsici]|nr:hypothetical protein DVH05_017511 [Phytophthora capsici]